MLNDANWIAVRLRRIYLLWATYALPERRWRGKMCDGFHDMQLYLLGVLSGLIGISGGIWLITYNLASEYRAARAAMEGKDG